MDSSKEDDSSRGPTGKAPCWTRSRLRAAARPLPPRWRSSTSLPLEQWAQGGVGGGGEPLSSAQRVPIDFPLSQVAPPYTPTVS